MLGKANIYGIDFISYRVFSTAAGKRSRAKSKGKVKKKKEKQKCNENRNRKKKSVTPKINPQGTKQNYFFSKCFQNFNNRRME